MLCFLILFNSVLSVTRFVDKGALGANNGLDWSNAFTSLQAAIDSGVDTLFVKGGTYVPDSGSDVDVSFLLKNDIKIYGGFAGSESTLAERVFGNPPTILSGELLASAHSLHVIRVTSTNKPSLIDNVHITGGKSTGNGEGGSGDIDGYGGGLTCTNVNENKKIIFTISNSKIYDNEARTGGGVYLYLGCDVTFINTTFSNNKAVKGTTNGGFGGAVAAVNGINPIFQKCSFFNNNAELSGGAMLLDYGCQVEIKESNFTMNKAEKLGGAIFVNDRNSQHQGSGLNISNSNFVANVAGERAAAIMLFLDVTMIYKMNEFVDNVVTNSANDYCITFDETEAIAIGTSNVFTRNLEKEVFITPTTSYISGGYTTSDLMRYVKSKSASTIAGLPPVPSNVRYVASSVSVSGNGQSWSGAYKTLQEGINECFLVKPCAVFVKEGTYAPTSEYFWTGFNNPQDRTILMKEDVDIYGGFGGTESSRDERDISKHLTLLSGNNFQLHVVMGANNAILDGFVIYGGKAGIGARRSIVEENVRRGATSPEALLNTAPTGSGGGMINHQTSPKVYNIVFYQNAAGKGGHMYNIKGSPTLENIVFYNGKAGRGGCVANDLQMTFRCKTCAFLSCFSSGKGGAIYNDFGILGDIQDSLFSSNKAYESGGVIVDDGGSNTNFTNTKFCNNYAEMNGGIIYQGSYNGTISAVKGGSVTRLDQCTTFGSSSKYGLDKYYSWHRDFIIVTNGVSGDENTCVLNIPDETVEDEGRRNSVQCMVIMVILMSMFFW